MPHSRFLAKKAPKRPHKPFDAEGLEMRMLCYAQSGEHLAHQWLTQQAYLLFADQFGQSEISQYLGDYSVDNSGTDTTRTTLIEGVYDEDVQGANPFGQGTPGLSPVLDFDHPSTNHFWAHHFFDWGRDFDDGISIKDSAANRAIKYFTGGRGLTGTVDAAWGSGQGAVRDEGIPYVYSTASNKPFAYYWLGHAAHLLQDLTLPAHALADSHFTGLDDDPVHDWIDGVEFSANGTGADGRPPAGVTDVSTHRYQQWAFQPSLGGVGRLANPISVITGPLRSPQQLSSMALPPEQQSSIPANPRDDVLPLYRLFLDVAGRADDFDSKDVNGQVTGGSLRGDPFADDNDYNNWTRTDLNSVADVVAPLAIKSTAELFRYFFSEVDSSPPQVSVRGISTGFANPTHINTQSLDLIADVVENVSGVDKSGYRFEVQKGGGLDWEPTISTWPAQSDTRTVSRTIGSLSDGLYRVRAIATNGAGMEGKSEWGYVAIDTSVPSPDRSPPTAALAFPANTGTVNAVYLNQAPKIIRIAFSDLGGSGVDPASVTDLPDEFTLSGSGVGTARIQAVTPKLVTASVYDYPFTGEFVPGTVTLSFAANAFTDRATPPNGSQPLTQTFTVTSTPVQTGGVQVTISPQDVVNAGALWRVSGGAFQNSGAIVSGLAVGTYQIEFNSVSGWVTPSSQTVEIKAGATASAVGAYSTSGTPPTTTSELIVNGSFEASSAPTDWHFGGTTGVFSNYTPVDGSKYALLGEAPSVTDTMYQELTVPTDATAATLWYWYNVTSEDTGTVANDLLYVQLQNFATGAATLVDQRSNLDRRPTATAVDYRQVSLNLLPFRGQTLRLAYYGNNNATLNTSFRIDDVHVRVTQPATPALQSLAISGPSSVDEDSYTAYAATAYFSDGSAQPVAAVWNEDSNYGAFLDGELITGQVPSDTSLTLTASYTLNGVTRTASKFVTIINRAPTLAGLTISGPSTVNESGTGQYSAVASFSDGSTQAVAADWAEDSAAATIDATGLLRTDSVSTDTSLNVTALYYLNGVTRMATRSVLIQNTVVTQPPSIDSFTDSPDTVHLHGWISLEATASDSDGTVSAVSFYAETNGVPGLQVDATGDSLIYVDDAAPYQIGFNTDQFNQATGVTYSYYAVATDNAGGVSAPAITTNTVGGPDLPPTLTSFTVTPNPVDLNGWITFSAAASDPDSAILGIGCYRESNGQVGLQTGTDGDTVIAISGNPFAMGFNTSGLQAGTYMYYAFAYDNEGASSPVAAVANTIRASNVGPAIDSFTDAPDPSPLHGTVTLEANASDDAAVASVSFYYEFNGQPGLQLGTGGDWLLLVDPVAPFACAVNTINLSPGTYTYYAFATDTDGVSSLAVATSNTIRPNQSPTIDGFSVSPGTAQWNGPITLSATATDPDGAVIDVSFYLEQNGIPGLQYGQDVFVGSDVTAPYSLVAAANQYAPGAHTWYAVADDNFDSPSDVAVATNTILPDRPPTFDSFTDSPDPVVSGGVVTLTATASDPDGDEITVLFYFDLNGVPGYQPGDRAIIDDWEAPYTALVDTANFEPGTYTYSATAFSGLQVSPPVVTLTNSVTPLQQTAPTATLVDAPNVTVAGSTGYYFKVTYADDTAVDYRSILAGSDVLVTGPGYSQSATPVNLPWSIDPHRWTATYYITAPGGTFDQADNGTYTISLQANAVSDTSGAFAAAGPLGSFSVNIVDTAPPVATLASHPDVTTPNAYNYFFTVNYTDNTAVNYQSLLAGNDVEVTGPAYVQPQPGTIASLTFAAGVWTATYYVLAPGGVFDAADNGAYVIWLRAGEVSDTNNNFAPRAPLGGFNVNLIDTTPPVATLASHPDVTTPGGFTYFFTVNYTDDVALNYQSVLTGNDVVVTGPGGYSRLGTIASLTRAGAVWTASYYVPAPGGTFDSADSGAYTISLRPNEVSDAAGNFTPGTLLGGFTVSLNDTVPPTATLASHPDVTSPGVFTYFFTVNYQDNVALDYNSVLTGNDVVVTGPGGYSRLGTIASLTRAGPVWTASYYVPAPGGTFDPAENGVYTISLRAGEVSDTAGNFAPAGSLGTFAVSIASAAAPPAVRAGPGDAVVFSDTLIVPQRRAASVRRLYDISSLLA
jgi:hypothetical protein